jgi:hypothetical protein
MEISRSSRGRSGGRIDGSREASRGDLERLLGRFLALDVLHVGDVAAARADRRLGALQHLCSAK